MKKIYLLLTLVFVAMFSSAVEMKNDEFNFRIQVLPTSAGGKSITRKEFIDDGGYNLISWEDQNNSMGINIKKNLDHIYFDTIETQKQYVSMLFPSTDLDNFILVSKSKNFDGAAGFEYQTSGDAGTTEIAVTATYDYIYIIFGVSKNSLIFESGMYTALKKSFSFVISPSQLRVSREAYDEGRNIGTLVLIVLGLITVGIVVIVRKRKRI